MRDADAPSEDSEEETLSLSPDSFANAYVNQFLKQQLDSPEPKPKQQQDGDNTRMSSVLMPQDSSNNSNDGDDGSLDRTAEVQDEHLQATEDMFNDTVESKLLNSSDSKSDLNEQFNTTAFLKEHIDALVQQDSTTDLSLNVTASTTDFTSNIPVSSVYADETTRDSIGHPHHSSTPLKQDRSSVSTTNLDLLKLEVDVGSFDVSSSSSDSSLEEPPAFTDEDGNNSEDSDNSGEENVLSEFLTGLGLQQNINETGVKSNMDLNLSDESVVNEEILKGMFEIFSKACILNDVKIHFNSELSVNQSILEIMDLYLKNQVSKAALSRTIGVMCKFLPEHHNLPTTSYEILRYIESLAPPIPALLHYYCRSCLYYHGVGIAGPCVICGSETEFNHFYVFDLAHLIKYFFEGRNLASIIDLDVQKRNNTDKTVLTDSGDGSEYKSINRNRAKYDISIILNTDGVRIRKGSKSELWLLMFTIAELPIHLQKSFLTVVGVWYHSKKPDMRTFLKPFAESMQSLDQSGVEWTHPITKEVHLSRVRLLVTVLDAPARAMVQNTMLFNSRYGCNLCEIKSQLSAPVPDLRNVRVYNYMPNLTLRTKDRMLKQAAIAGELGEVHVKGVKGPSSLSIVPSADISKCIVPEYLHSVLIGVVKQTVHIWTTERGNWSLKENISEIDAFLVTFKHPDFVHRKLRQLKSLSFWKASDYYYFLLFESLPALHGILLNKYFQHFLLLVKAIYTLLKSPVSKLEVDEAELLLELFVADFSTLYGDRAQTHNVHQLLHLAMCVRRYGPLFCFSAFPFEDMNGLIAKATHGTQNVDREIVNNIKICQGVEMLRNIVRGHHGIAELNGAFCSQGELLGKVVERNSLLSEELEILQDSNAQIYSKAKIGYDIYTSEIYKQISSEDFYIMWKNTNNEIKYGSVRYFAHSKCDKFVVMRLFHINHTEVFYNESTHKCIEHFVR